MSMDKEKKGKDARQAGKVEKVEVGVRVVILVYFLYDAEANRPKL